MCLSRTAKTEKQNLRQRLRAENTWDASSPEALAAEQKALTHLLPLGIWGEADAVFSFVAMTDELPTAALNEAALAAGKPLALPRIDAALPGVMHFFSNTGAPVHPGDFEHPLFIVPGLAFTCKGERLGRGRGYYDRYLSALAPLPPCIGWCLPHRLLDAIPTEAHDIRMTCVVTPDVAIFCSF
jgi:5-formyltetrahydrofolate cyclo-ligase